MATGDRSDFLRRLQAALPSGWFADVDAVRDAILGGLASAWVSIYALWLYVKAQTRIATATGVFLDGAAADFFGRRLTRRHLETDAHFSARIRASLLQPMATRAAVRKAVGDLTGFYPIIFEPQNTGDTGAYCIACGYGVAGGYGSLMLPSQFFIAAARPVSGGIAGVGGYYTRSGWAGGGYGVGALEYAQLSMMVQGATDADVDALVASIIPAGSIAWITHQGATAQPTLNGTFKLDNSYLS